LYFTNGAEYYSSNYGYKPSAELDGRYSCEIDFAGDKITDVNMIKIQASNNCTGNDSGYGVQSYTCWETNNGKINASKRRTDGVQSKEWADINNTNGRKGVCNISECRTLSDVNNEVACVTQPASDDYTNNWQCWATSGSNTNITGASVEPAEYRKTFVSGLWNSNTFQWDSASPYYCKQKEGECRTRADVESNVACLTGADNAANWKCHTISLDPSVDNIGSTQMSNTELDYWRKNYQRINYTDTNLRNRKGVGNCTTTSEVCRKQRDVEKEITCHNSSDNYVCWEILNPADSNVQARRTNTMRKNYDRESKECGELSDCTRESDALHTASNMCYGIGEDYENAHISGKRCYMINETDVDTNTPWNVPVRKGIRYNTADGYADGRLTKFVQGNVQGSTSIIETFNTHHTTTNGYSYGPGPYGRGHPGHGPYGPGPPGHVTQIVMGAGINNYNENETSSPYYKCESRACPTDSYETKAALCAAQEVSCYVQDQDVDTYVQSNTRSNMSMVYDSNQDSCVPPAGCSVRPYCSYQEVLTNNANAFDSSEVGLTDCSAETLYGSKYVWTLETNDKDSIESPESDTNKSAYAKWLPMNNNTTSTSNNLCVRNGAITMADPREVSKSNQEYICQCQPEHYSLRYFRESNYSDNSSKGYSNIQDLEWNMCDDSECARFSVYSAYVKQIGCVGEDQLSNIEIPNDERMMNCYNQNACSHLCLTGGMDDTYTTGSTAQEVMCKAPRTNDIMNRYTYDPKDDVVNNITGEEDTCIINDCSMDGYPLCALPDNNDTTPWSNTTNYSGSTITNTSRDLLDESVDKPAYRDQNNVQHNTSCADNITTDTKKRGVYKYTRTVSKTPTDEETCIQNQRTDTKFVVESVDNENFCPIHCKKASKYTQGTCETDCDFTGSSRTDTKNITTQPEYDGDACTIGEPQGVIVSGNTLRKTVHDGCPSQLPCCNPSNSDHYNVSHSYTNAKVSNNKTQGHVNTNNLQSYYDNPNSIPCNTRITKRSTYSRNTQICKDGTIPDDTTASQDNNDTCDVDCVVSAWSDWGPCSTQCGSGKQTRTRSITVNQVGNGAACSNLGETRKCNNLPCCTDADIQYTFTLNGGQKATISKQDWDNDERVSFTNPIYGFDKSNWEENSMPEHASTSGTIQVSASYNNSCTPANNSTPTNLQTTSRLVAHKACTDNDYEVNHDRYKYDGSFYQSIDAVPCGSTCGDITNILTFKKKIQSRNCDGDDEIRNGSLTKNCGPCVKTSGDYRFFHIMFHINNDVIPSNASLMDDFRFLIGGTSSGNIYASKTPKSLQTTKYNRDYMVFELYNNNNFQRPKLSGDSHWRYDGVDEELTPYFPRYGNAGWGTPDVLQTNTSFKKIKGFDAKTSVYKIKTGTGTVKWLQVDRAVYNDSIIKWVTNESQATEFLIFNYTHRTDINGGLLDGSHHDTNLSWLWMRMD
jgi:hypothetical protein